VYSFKVFVKTAVLGGVAVVLPLALFIIIFKWIFTTLTDIIQPLTNLVVARSHFPELAADLIVAVIILALCFVVGVVVRTKFGHFVQEGFEERIMKIAPGYPMIKSIVTQFLGRKKRAFSSVVIVRAFENDTLMTGFITDEHADGSYSVFVPTAPNPTTGFVFHLQPQFVHPIKVSVERAFRTILGCGTGSADLIQAYHDTVKAKPSAE
jgi:uncharacterized membrane protein